MRTKTLAAIGGLGVVAVTALVAGVVAPRLSAQPQGPNWWVIPVTNGDSTCRAMTNDLRNDRDAWRTPYVNYMAGFVTGADYVSSLVPGRKSQVDLPQEVLANHARAADGMFALLEKYCAQNPAKYISEGAMRVYSQLYSQTAAQ
jgi:hypothetical protein